MPELPRVSQDFTADTGPFVAAIQEAIGSLKEFTSAISDAITKIGELDSAIKGLPDTVTITLTMNGLDKALEDVADLKLGLDSIHDKTITTTVRTVYENVGTPLNNLVTKGVNEQITVPVTNPNNSSSGVITELVDMGLGLPGEKGSSNPNTALDLTNLLSAGGGFGSGSNGGIGVPTDLASLSSSISALSNVLVRVRSDAGGANAAIDSMSNSSRALYGWWRLLGREVPLWAGVFGDNHIIGATQIWHIALDGLIEATIALGEAAIGLGIAFAAMAPEALAIANRVVAVHEVTATLGAALPGITGSFHQLSESMDPGVVEIYGGALNLISHNGSVLAQVVTELVHGFDQWVAKLDVFAASASHTGGILTGSVEVLHQFEEILDNIGIALDNFVKADPGTVHFLLDFFVGATKVLDVITSLPSPLLKAVLALHAIDLWGGLAATAIVKMIGPTASLISVFGKLGGALGLGDAAVAVDDFGRALRGMPASADAAKMSAKEIEDATTSSTTVFQNFASKIMGFAADNPWTAIAAAIIIALTAASVYILKAKSATQDWIDTTNKAVANASDMDQINTTVQALAANTDKLSMAQSNLSSKTSAWSALASGAQENTSALAAQHKQLTGDIFTETENLGYLTTKYGVDIPTAISYANAAGVKLTTGMTGQSNAAAVARQQIQNLITGYQNLGQQGSQVAADINAATIANSAQYAAVQKLNSAWATTIALASNMQVGFISFEQGLQTIQGDAKATGASFDGMNSQSLTLRNDFETNIGNMSSNLGNLNTALSFGGLSWNQYRSAIATMVGEMASAGNLSGAQKAQLGEIASAAGYTGSSYSSLSGWVSKFGGSESQLNGVMDQATIAMSNQKTIVGQLQGTLQSSVINATANAVLAQGGFQAALSKTYDALMKGGTSSKSFKDDLAKVDSTLKAAGFSTTQISQYNVQLEKSFKDAGSGADNLGSKTGDLNNSFDQTKIKSDGLRDQIKNVFIAIGHYAEDYTDAAREAIIKGWDDAYQFTSGIVKEIANAVHTAWSDVANFTTSIWTGIKNIASSIWQATLGVIRSLASQFDAWWKTHGSALEAIWNALWGAIKSQAEEAWNAITTIVDAGWNVLKGMFEAAASTVRGMWTEFWSFLKEDTEWFWNGIEPIISLAWNLIKALFDAAMGVIKAAWQIFWDTLKVIAEDLWALIEAETKMAWDDLVGIFDIFIDLLSGHWKTMWEDIKNLGVQNWNIIKGFFETAWNNFHSYASGIFHTIGTDLVGGLKNGIMSAASSIGNFVKDYLVNPIINAVKKFFGIASPSTVFAEMGGHLVSGLVKGIEHSPDDLIKDAFGGWPAALEALVKKGAIDVSKLGGSALKELGKLGGDIGSFFSSLFSGGKSSGSVVGWLEAAMAATGTPQSWLSGLEIIVNGESGGNPNAINLTDSNAAAGDPSRGLMQTIMSTFSEYHQSGTSDDIYNPIANAAAAINYIKAVYGSIGNVPGVRSVEHGGGYVGYDSGGLLQPGYTMAYNGTGQPEHIISPSGAGGPGGDLHTHIYLGGTEVATAILPNLQQAIYRQNIRNNGIGGITGAVRPGA